MSNYSKQREIILDIFKELYHPTADEIYDMVHQIDPVISKSTVYRNISVLLKDKVLKKIKVLNGADKYDYNSKEHYHVICKKCGNVFDFMYYFNHDELVQNIEHQTGVVTNIDSLTLYGICEKCKTLTNEEE